MMLAALIAAFAAVAAPKPITIVGELKPTAPGAFTYIGTWTAKGAIADEGTLTAGPTVISTNVTAIDKLTGKRGGVVLKLQGPAVNLAHWHWSIVSGTGSYKKLRGGGTAAIDQSDPDNVHEVLKGTVTPR